MHNLVVIIDDDPISILVCETMLKKSQFSEKIKTFYSAKAGLDFLRKHYADGHPAPDFIFLDILMPEMDGWGFMDAYREFENIPNLAAHVIMFSANFELEEKQRIADNNMIIKFLPKPITKEALDDLSKQK